MNARRPGVKRIIRGIGKSLPDGLSPCRAAYTNRTSRPRPGAPSVAKFLFGPADAEFAADSLAGPRAAGDCLALGIDVPCGPGDSWADLAARLPAGWVPDFVALWLAYTRVPRGCWDAPVPVVGLAADANLLWHQYAAQLPRCDLVLADRPSVEAFAAAGLRHARPACLFGLGKSWLDARRTTARATSTWRSQATRTRPSTGPASRGSAGSPRWAAGRVKRSDRGRRVRGRLPGPATAGPSWRSTSPSEGEANKRAFEAAAAGCVLLQEAGNAELPLYLTPGENYAPYAGRDFEAVVGRLLADDGLRGRMAAAARRRAPGLTFEALWAACRRRRDRAPAGRPARRRPRGGSRPARRRPGSRRVGGPRGRRTRPAETRWPRRPRPGRRLPGRGLGARPGQGRRLLRTVPGPPGRDRRQGVRPGGGRPRGRGRRRRPGRPACRRRRGRPGPLRHAPPASGFAPLRVDWERAAFDAAGDPAATATAKRGLLRGRLHALLAELTGDL